MKSLVSTYAPAAVFSLLMLSGVVSCWKDPIADAWIGHNVAELERVWGKPTEEIADDKGGTRTYVSYWNRSLFTTEICRRVFTIDQRGIITAYAQTECSR